MTTSDLIRQYLIDNCHYDASNGLFLFKTKGSKRTIGKICGSNHHSGYKTMYILKKHYGVHRLVWLIETGDFPKNHIDHINGNKSDNRFQNLRDVNQRINNSNLQMHRDGKLPGCHFDKWCNRWKSQINIGKRRIHLGRFDSELEAHNRYIQEIKRLGL